MFPRLDVEPLEDDDDLEPLLLLLVEDDLETLLLLEDELFEREILRVLELLLFIRVEPERVVVLFERDLVAGLVVVGLVLVLVVPILFLDEFEVVPILLFVLGFIADLLLVVLLLRSLTVVRLVFELFTELRLPITDISPFDA